MNEYIENLYGFVASDIIDDYLDIVDALGDVNEENIKS